MIQNRRRDVILRRRVGRFDCLPRDIELAMTAIIEKEEYDEDASEEEGEEGG